MQAGIYYPAASLYMGGQVTYNFGPDFKYPMPDKPDGVTVACVCVCVCVLVCVCVCVLCVPSV